MFFFRHVLRRTAGYSLLNERRVSSVAGRAVKNIKEDVGEAQLEDHPK